MPRRTALLAVTALVAALLSPLLVASPAQAGQMTGTMTKSFTNYFGPEWVDATISDDFTVGVAYSDTLQLPDVRPVTFYDDDDAQNSIPAGLSIDYVNDGSYPGNPVFTLSGTPTTASASTTIVIAFNGYAGDEMWLTFTNVVIKAAPTTTTLDGDSYWKYDDVHLNATVSPVAATGTVEFFLDGTSVGTSSVNAGAASYVGAVPTSFVGSSPVVTAVYSGDSWFAGSTSTSDPIVYVYGDRIISGSVLRNGIGVEGEAVRLLTSTYALAGPTDTTDANGEFQLEVGDPPSFFAAQEGYAIEAVGLGVYYSSSPGPGGSNVSLLGDATVVFEADWDSGLVLIYNTPPVWTDGALAQPRLGEAYSDSVVATTTGASTAITYDVTGDVPAWLTFTAGTFTATNPTDQDPHTFTVTATSAYRYNVKQFTLTAQNAWIAPSFTDGTIATAQAGVQLDDEVLASGDGPITYSVTGGALPAWLTLGADGSITGTAPLSSVGEFYWFTVTATGHGIANTLIADVVAPAPTVAIDLDFEVGDIAVGSTFDFAVTGADDAVPYSVTINSVPYVAASGLTSALGTASGTAAIHSAIDAGAHSIVLTTLASDGTPRTMTVWFTVLADGTIGAISLTGPIAFIDAAALASTGTTLMLPLAGGMLLLLGGAFFVGRRAGEPGDRRGRRAMRASEQP